MTQKLTDEERLEQLRRITEAEAKIRSTKGSLQVTYFVDR